MPHSDGSATNEQRGDAYYEQMAYSNALEFYEKALAKDPKNKAIQLKIARCYEKLNNQEEVSYYASQSVSHSSATPDDVLAYADALSSIESYDRSTRMYSRYGQMNSDDSRVDMKKEALKDIKSFYEDSLAYMVSPVDFNSEQSDFAPAYNGEEVFFISNRGKAKLFQSINMRDGSFFLDMYKVSGDMAVKVDKISQGLHEGPMSFFEGGSKVIVTTNYPFVKKNADLGNPSTLRLVIYEKGADGWVLNSEFPHNNIEYSVGHPSFDEKTSTLYFASNKPDGKGGVDIYSSSYSGGTWGEPVNVERINTEGDDLFPFVQDGDIFFSSNGRGGLGGLDIYKTKIGGGTIYTMGYPVNTSKDDFGIVLDQSGKRGYLSSNREGGLGSDDIYEVLIYRIRIEVKVIDEKTGQPIKGNLKIVDSRTGEEVPYTMNGDKAVYDGLRGRTYVITSDQEGYAGSEAQFKADTKEEMMAVSVPMQKKEEAVEVEGAEGASVVRVDNLANPVYYRMSSKKLVRITATDLGPNDKPIVIEDVYFKFDSDVIAKGVGEIDKVVAILKAYPVLTVDITSYCDARGSVKYNERLAERRAQRVEDYMKSNGIEPDRIRAVLIGKAELYEKCDKCNEDQHQRNRRVEFTMNVD